MNKDQVVGRIDEAKGKAAEIVGKIVGNKDLEQKGKADKIDGKLRAGFGDVKHEIADKIDKA